MTVREDLGNSIALTRGSRSQKRHKLRLRGGPSGLHIFDRTTGLNILIDEARVPEEAWASAPRQVSIALTNACDLRCPYCSAPKSPAILAFPRLTEWLHDLDRNGCLGVGFGGGEPTLYSRFAELCRYTVNNTQLAVTFTTHGHRIDDSLVSSLAGSVHFVRISMDGVRGRYERLRGRSFSGLLDCLRRVRELAPFGINFVVNALTLPDLDAATCIAASLGAKQFLLLPEQPRMGIGGIDERTKRALTRWVDRYRGPVPLAVSEIGAEGMPVCIPIPLESGLRSYAHIDATGVLKESSYTTFGVPIGAGGVMRAVEALRIAKEVRPG